jgi:hypothetical protein
MPVAIVTTRLYNPPLQAPYVYLASIYLLALSLQFTLYTMAPDTTSIPGYTIFHEEDYGSSSAASQISHRTPHPLGMFALHFQQKLLLTN